MIFIRLHMPIARLLAAFVSVRDRQKPMYPVRTKRACPACGNVAPADRAKAWRSLSVFGIEVYGWKRTVTETCRACHGVIRTGKASFVQAALWMFS